MKSPGSDIGLTKPTQTEGSKKEKPVKGLRTSVLTETQHTTEL